MTVCRWNGPSFKPKIFRHAIHGDGRKPSEPAVCYDPDRRNKGCHCTVMPYWLKGCASPQLRTGQPPPPLVCC